MTREWVELESHGPESSLAEGLLFERRQFHAGFSLEDQKEGMRAFLERRKPEFFNR